MFDVLDEINYQSYNDFVLRVGMWRQAIPSLGPAHPFSTALGACGLGLSSRAGVTGPDSLISQEGGWRHSEELPGMQGPLGIHDLEPGRIIVQLTQHRRNLDCLRYSQIHL